MTESIRLAKRLASQLACSRSEAEKYIESGYVRVDAVVVEEPGFRVLAGQQVELLPGATLDAVEAITILLHKPVGFDIETSADAVYQLITPENQFAEDRSGLRLIKRHFKELSLTDPLGKQSSGLVVLTQDWRIARKLKTDAEKIEQEFVVEVEGEILQETLDQLNRGLLPDGKILPVKVSRQSESRLRFAVKGNRRIQIAALCEKAGLIVKAMKRIRIGRIPMATLQAGQWRYLMAYEKF
jgi:23S rRNA pseudouridine2604 synthase